MHWTLALEKLYHHLFSTNRNTSKLKGSTLQGSLLLLWMDENVSQQSNEKSLTMENLQLLSEITTKLARAAPTQGIAAGALTR